MEFLASLEATGLSRYIQESDWGHPILLVFHAVGMALVVGIVLMMDFRTLGYAKAVPVIAFERLFQLAWIGFILNAISGILIFFSNATRLITNWTFQVKIALIIAGAISLWILWRDLRAGIAAGAIETTGRQKVTAALSIVFWLGALVAGRLIAYTLAPNLPG